MARIEPLMTVTEVSEYFRKSEKTIKRWVDDGDLKCSSVPKGEMMFDPDYIRSIGRVDFKVGISSPEVYKLNKIIDQKDETIESLTNDFCELLSELSVLQSKASQCAIKALNAI